MLPAALTLLERGCAVLPIRPDGSKRPLLPSWAEFQARLPTKEEVTQWWTLYPEAWVGIVTGAVSNLVVVDVDGKVSDPATFAAAHGLQQTEAVKTPRGGAHFYYTHPGGHVRNGVGVAHFGDASVDIRGDGGFVVAPPSPGYVPARGGFGRALYTPVKASQPAVTTIDQILTANPAVDDLFAPAPLGQRNHASARLAGYLLKTCSDEQAAYIQLAQWNTRNLPPLDERELRMTFDSIAQRHRSNAVVQGQAITHARPPASEFDWFESGAWADAVANQPDRKGQVLRSLPLTSLHKGCCPGDVIAIAARPGTGKTALVCQTMDEIGISLRESCFFFSGDMSPADILNWMTRGRLGVGRYTKEEWQHSLALLRDTRMAIKHSGIIEVGRVRFMLENRPGTRYVFIDHFNKMDTGSATRASDLKRIAKDLKDLAVQFGATFIVLSQINREGEGSQSLTRANIAESDALVQESDVIYGLTLVGNPMMQDQYRATVELTLIKNRFGQDGAKQTAYFHKDFRSYEWLDRSINWNGVN